MGTGSFSAVSGDLSGNDNIGIGSFVMQANNGVVGNNNIALGYSSLRANQKIAGSNNIAIGSQTLIVGNNDVGSYNVGIGSQALSDDLGVGTGNIQIGNRNIGTPLVGLLNEVIAIGNKMSNLTLSTTTSNVILLGNNHGGDAPKIGMGTYKPQAKLHVNGSIIIANDTNTCNNDTEGAIRYNRPSKQFQGCDGSNWINLH